MGEHLLDVNQVRLRLGCSRSHVYTLINEGKLLCVRIGRTKGFRVPEKSLRAFLSSRSEG